MFNTTREDGREALWEREKNCEDTVYTILVLCNLILTLGLGTGTIVGSTLKLHTTSMTSSCSNEIDVAAVKIRPAVEDDIPAVHALVREVHWNETLIQTQSYFAATRNSPEGFLVAELAGKVIGCIVAAVISDDVCFGGVYIVTEKYRGKGIGRDLNKARFAFVGKRNFGINSVNVRVASNLKIGFSQSPWAFGWYKGTIDPKTIEVSNQNSSLLDLSQVNIEGILQYDSTIHPFPRPLMITSWLRKDQTTTRILKRNDLIVGYGSLQPAVNGFRIAPLYADDAEGAKTIMADLLSLIPEGEIVDIYAPSDNRDLLRIVKDNKDTFVEHELGARRMYTKYDIPLPLGKIFAFCTPDITLL